MLSRRRFIQLSTGAAAIGLSTASYGVGIEPLLRLRVANYQVHPQRWLAGLGDQLAYWPARRFRPVPRIGVDDLKATLAKVTDDAPVILLAHEPDVAMRVPSRVALQLSGHTHGGQVRLLGWSPVVPSRYGNKFAYGHARTACDVIVSGGLGCSIVPVRIGVPPEIVQVTVSAALAVMS
jgi:uncharacterized protein